MMDERIEAQRIILKEGVNLETKIKELEDEISALKEKIKTMEESEENV